MSTGIPRRDALKYLSATLAVGAVGGTTAAAQQTPTAPAGDANEPQKLAAYPCDGKIWVNINERMFTCYRADDEQKYPYFYPVLGPASGLPMTEETALPWPHHRSLFLGCDKVNGGNYWQAGPKDGQIVSRGAAVEKSGADRVVISDVCDWHKPDQPVIIEDQRRFTITAPSPDLRMVDADITITAKTDIRIAKTNHALFSVRAARLLAPIDGGTLLNAEGNSGEKATFGLESPWCGFQGTRLGVSECIVLMHHPANPLKNPRWFTRDYGFMSPMPFFWQEQDWTLPEGESIRLRYRVVAAKGLIVPAEVNRIYREFAV